MTLSSKNTCKEDKLESFITDSNLRLQQLFHNYLKDIPAPRLREAMTYSLLNGGKRLRPLLIYATGQAFAAPLANLDAPACAIEMIHTYSLIHDDLPAMDNSDLRRGKPTCHKAFDEAMAILAGDGLQALAFQIIAHHPAALSCEQRLQMINLLSTASGAYGMVAGQAFDMNEMQNPTAAILEKTYRFKTGALLAACIELGMLAANNIDAATYKNMQKFGENIGLAFQIQDDILDIERTTESLGKPQGLDVINQKITYPVLHGMENSKQKITLLFQEARDLIAPFGEQAEMLLQLAAKITNRIY